MGNNYGNVLLVTPGRLALLIQDGHLPVRDQPPVLHRPRAEVRDCNHVLLGQGERGVEVVLVVGQDLGSDLRGPLGLVVTALQKIKSKMAHDLEMFPHLSRPYAKLYPIVSRLKELLSLAMEMKEGVKPRISGRQNQKQQRPGGMWTF